MEQRVDVEANGTWSESGRRAAEGEQELEANWSWRLEEERRMGKVRVVDGDWRTVKKDRGVHLLMPITHFYIPPISIQVFNFLSISATVTNFPLCLFSLRFLCLTYAFCFLLFMRHALNVLNAPEEASGERMGGEGKLKMEERWVGRESESMSRLTDENYDEVCDANYDEVGGCIW